MHRHALVRFTPELTAAQSIDYGYSAVHKLNIYDESRLTIRCSCRPRGLQNFSDEYHGTESTPKLSRWCTRPESWFTRSHHAPSRLRRLLRMMLRRPGLCRLETKPPSGCRSCSGAGHAIDLLRIGPSPGAPLCHRAGLGCTGHRG